MGDARNLLVLVAVHSFFLHMEKRLAWFLAGVIVATAFPGPINAIKGFAVVNGLKLLNGNHAAKSNQVDKRTGDTRSNPKLRDRKPSAKPEPIGNRY